MGAGPRAVEAQRLLGEIFETRQGDCRQAIVEYQRLIGLDPDGAGPWPLALIVHGNHNYREFSDPGYAYLGDLLASRGFIMVSVDENFINGLSAENDGRAWLLLKHLEAWKQFNEAAKLQTILERLPEILQASTGIFGAVAQPLRERLAHAARGVTTA